MMKSVLIKIKSFILECKRVLRVTRKPTNTEFKMIVKVSALGMALIGLMGFFIQIIKRLIFP